MEDSICSINNFKVRKVVFNDNKLNQLELELINELENDNIPYELGKQNNKYVIKYYSDNRIITKK